MPEMTFHSVIERPLSVRRVRPPTTTMAKTSPALKYSQYPTMGLVATTSEAALVALWTWDTDTVDENLLANIVS